MKLVIAEKPSVAKAYAAALGVKGRKEGCWEGDRYLISWCVGHLAGLADAALYDPRYAKWRSEDLPILPDNWRFVIRSDRKKQFDTLCALMAREDVTEIVNACDAGREGERIFRNVYQALRLPKADQAPLALLYGGCGHSGGLSELLKDRR